MKPTVLVTTTVHWPDDTRIRERLIRTIADDFSVVYATSSPGPTDVSGLDWVELPGARLRRNLRVLRLALFGTWDLLVLHDPETLVAGWMARLRGKPVVFDVHEDFPSIAHSRDWVPKWARGPLSGVTRLALAVSERVLDITLAEPGYARWFSRSHPVFPNYPNTVDYPEPADDRRQEAVYVGDVTLARGVDVAVDACSRTGISLRLIGRITPELEADLRDRSGLENGLVFEGLLPNPEALRRVAGAGVGLAPLRDIPNYRDSQPTKILEYLALGVPVVSSDLPGTRTLVEGLEAVYLVPAGDAEALAEAIGQALRPDVREVARTQIPLVRERYRWPANEVRAFYTSLL